MGKAYQAHVANMTSNNASRDTDDESISHNQKENGVSCGCVENEELVVLAVFENENFVYDEASATRMFSTRRLRKFEVSTARPKHTSKVTFLDCVVEPAQKNKGSLVGVVANVAGAIRSIRSKIRSNGTVEQAFRVIDLVEPRDYDGHAAIGFSKPLQRPASDPLVSEPDIHVMRAQAVLDLKEKFENIVELCSVYWKKD